MYLYYLSQVPMALCPISNDALFVKFANSPVKAFHEMGIPISLNTDDPLQFHVTGDPILEEYISAAKLFSLTKQDLCEIARTSVRMSNFDFDEKVAWLGASCGLAISFLSNDPNKTNVTSIRADFRQDAHQRELEYIYLRGMRLDELPSNGVTLCGMALGGSTSNTSP